METTIQNILQCLKNGDRVYLNRDETGFSDIDRYNNYDIYLEGEMFKVEHSATTKDACTPGYFNHYEWNEANLLRFLQGQSEEDLKKVYLKTPPVIYPDKVVLYQLNTPDLRVLVTASYTESGDLLVDGCDSGEYVRQRFGTHSFTTFAERPLNCNI